MSKKLVLNQAPTVLERDQAATMDFAPAASLLVSFENQNITYTAAGSYSQGGGVPQSINLYAGQLIPSSHVVDGNGSNITLRNTSQNPNSVISGGVFGMGEPTNGYIQQGGNMELGQFKSVLGVTTPSWQKFRLTAQTTDKETVIYVFGANVKPQGYVLNYTGSGNTDFKTTSGNQLEETGNWGGNALFFINVSNSPQCGVDVSLNAL